MVEGESRQEVKNIIIIFSCLNILKSSKVKRIDIIFFYLYVLNFKMKIGGNDIN